MEMCKSKHTHYIYENTKVLANLMAAYTTTFNEQSYWLVSITSPRILSVNCIIWIGLHSHVVCCCIF